MITLVRFCSLLVGLMLPASPTPPQTLGQSANGAVWVDARNQYFTIIPPPGWTPQVYEDARTKVAWRHPRDSRVVLSIIARKATEDFAGMRADANRTAAGWRAKGLTMAVTEEKLGDTPAVVSQAHLPGGGRARLFLFLVRGVHFNVQFAAPSDALFDANAVAAQASLESITAQPGKSNPGAREAEELSWYRRYAFLLAKLGNKTASQALAREGLARFPGDSELEKLAR